MVIECRDSHDVIDDDGASQPPSYDEASAPKIEEPTGTMRGQGTLTPSTISRDSRDIPGRSSEKAESTFLNLRATKRGTFRRQTVDTKLIMTFTRVGGHVYYLVTL